MKLMNRVKAYWASHMRSEPAIIPGAHEIGTRIRKQEKEMGLRY